LNVAGIAWRSYLAARPPVATIYDMILFVPTVAAAAALLLERLNRRRVAIGFAALIGAFGLYGAGRWEAHEAFAAGVDTLPKLQAVLDTTLWLSLHVVTVSIGYAAGLLAGLLAHVHVVARVLRLRQGDVRFFRPIARMTWGVLCCALVFSLLGSIFGGLWANESWGRFWGWDPEENGGLMVCAFLFALVELRIGGRLNDLALCLGAVFCTTLIAFSWWHVSVLGVGLHAYGFQHGIREKLWLFYGVEWLVVAAGLRLWWQEWRRDRRRANRSPTSSDAAGAGLAAS
jgi:ABC-type transport system involved in cytochrome c biogenesis permease subunit